MSLPADDDLSQDTTCVHGPHATPARQEPYFEFGIGDLVLIGADIFSGSFQHSCIYLGKGGDLEHLFWDMDRQHIVSRILKKGHVVSRMSRISQVAGSVPEKSFPVESDPRDKNLSGSFQRETAPVTMGHVEVRC